MDDNSHYLMLMDKELREPEVDPLSAVALGLAMVADSIKNAVDALSLRNEEALGFIGKSIEDGLTSVGGSIPDTITVRLEK